MCYDNHMDATPQRRYAIVGPDGEIRSILSPEFKVPCPSYLAPGERYAEVEIREIGTERK